MTFFNKFLWIQTTYHYSDAYINKIKRTQKNNTKYLSIKTKYKL